MLSATFKIHQGRLFLLTEGREIEAHIKSCFPWSEDKQFFSIRDSEDNELVLLESLDDLDPENRSIFEEFRKMSNFIIRITSVNHVEEDVELRHFDVETNIGKKLFQTKLEDWPDIMDDGRILIKDLSGDLFLIEDLESMDRKSLKLLEPYIA